VARWATFPNVVGAGDDEAVGLLRSLIRNRAVPGNPEGDQASVGLLQDLFAGTSIEFEAVESEPGRPQLVARLAGPGDGPRVLYLAHSDVAPVADESAWAHPPFAGDLDDDGVVWGRGAAVGLTYVATMATALRRLADRGAGTHGDVSLVVAGDCFNEGRLGIEWLLDHRPDVFEADVAFSEAGGHPVPSPRGTALSVLVAEKGVTHVRVTLHGPAGFIGLSTPGVTRTLAEALDRLHGHRPPAVITPLWEQAVEGLGFGDLMSGLGDADRIDDAIATLPDELSRFLHVQTHTTLSVVRVEAHPGSATVLPDAATVDVAVGLLAGQDEALAEDLVTEALGDLAADADVAVLSHRPPSASPADSRWVEAVAAVVGRWHDQPVVVPTTAPLPTPGVARLRATGVPVYGAGAYSARIPTPTLANLPMTSDDRIDVDSVAMMAELWEELPAAVVTAGSSPDAGGR
jgi:acetylornithine deacetylase/succinyl-diaminopimelate desuccinylase-like protein